MISHAMTAGVQTPQSRGQLEKVRVAQAPGRLNDQKLPGTIFVTQHTPPCEASVGPIQPTPDYDIGELTVKLPRLVASVRLTGE